MLSCETEPYVTLEQGIRDTWGKYESPQAKIFYYYGGKKHIETVGDKLHLSAPEGYWNIGRKTLQMYEYFMNTHEFDYLYRVNSSSFVCIHNLLKYIHNKPRQGFYSGFPVTHTKQTDMKFASGAGYFLSRDLVESIVKNKHMWNHSRVDDVALGQLMKQLDVNLHPAGCVHVKIHDNYKPDTDPDAYHYRCKHWREPRTNDVEMMKILYNYYKSNEIF